MTEVTLPEGYKDWPVEARASYLESKYRMQNLREEIDALIGLGMSVRRLIEGTSFRETKSSEEDLEDE